MIIVPLKWLLVCQVKRPRDRLTTNIYGIIAI